MDVVMRRWLAFLALLVAAACFALACVIRATEHVLHVRCGNAKHAAATSNARKASHRRITTSIVGVGVEHNIKLGRKTSGYALIAPVMPHYVVHHIKAMGKSILLFDVDETLTLARKRVTRDMLDFLDTVKSKF